MREGQDVPCQGLGLRLWPFALLKNIQICSASETPFPCLSPPVINSSMCFALTETWRNFLSCVPQWDPLKLKETLEIEINFEFLRSFLSTLLGTESDVNSTKALRGSLKSLCCVSAAKLGQAPGTEAALGHQEELQKDISAEEQLLSQPSRAEGTACRH